SPTRSPRRRAWSARTRARSWRACSSSARSSASPRPRACASRGRSSGVPGRASRALLIAALFFVIAPASGLRDVPAEVHAVHLHHSHVEITGGTDVDTPRVERALERVLATRVGLRAAWLIDSGALGHPLHIELNAHGDNHTIYRVPGVE